MASWNHFPHINGGCQHLPSPAKSPRSTTQGVRAAANTSYQEATTAPDLRRVLGVGPNASKGDLKAAYRRLALQFHPDVCKGETCSVRFLEVNRAYESLMNLLASSSRTRPPNEEAFSSYNANPNAYAYYQPQSSSRSENEDPWADFLQSLMNGTYDEQFSSQNAAGNSTRASTTSSFEGNW